MTRTFVFLVVGTVGCLCSPARAEIKASAVTAELVCNVQDAIRWREPAWTSSRCDRIAAALNATPAPAVLLAVAINESDLRPRAIARHGDRSDVGLLGIRCVHGKGHRCTNGPAAGLTIRSLMEPTTNIRVGAAVLASKASVEDWNGAGRDGYATRIAAIVAALGGARVEVKNRRVRKLVEQIAAAVNNERRS